MAKKSFNLKPLLMEKGERIGLYAAAAISGLLVVMGVLKGFSAGSASANAERLNEYTAKLEQSQKNARPTGADLPPPPTGTDPFTSGMRADASKLSSDPLFWPPKVKDMMRQVPNIFQPQDFQVAVLRAPLPSLDFVTEMRGEREVPVRVTVVKKTDMGMGDKGMPPNPFGANNKLGQALPSMLGPQAGAGGMQGQAGGMMKGSLGYRAGPKSVQGNEVKSIGIAEADNLQPGWVLADKVLPLRMAVIAATFPYKKQVEEFRQKLRLDTHGAVLTERVRGEKGESWNSFQFRGIVVERAAVEIGKPLEWEAINIEDPYKRLLILTGRHLEKDPDKYKPIKDVSLGLVLELPRQYKEGQYPDLFAKLDKIKDVLAVLSDTSKSKEIVTPKLIDQGFNPFDLTGQGTKVDPDPENPMNPELKTPGHNPFVIAGTGAQREIKETPIDHCLLRFIDVSLEPGKVYRYRVRVKMANPNYSPKPAERKDTYPQFAKEKELLSDWVEIPQPVVVPADSAIYVKDSKTLNEATLHMQRWVEDYRPDPKKPDVRPVGEWVIAATINVRRGEYVRDRNVKTPIPIKNLNATQFELDEKSVLEFGDESVLVNFEGGKLRYERTIKEGEKERREYVNDEAATEILVMTPDGRVYARNSYNDEQNPERKVREVEYRDRIKEIKDMKNGSGNPLGNPLNP